MKFAMGGITLPIGLVGVLNTPMTSIVTSTAKLWPLLNSWSA